MPKPRSLKKDAEIAVIPGNPLVLRGARNVRTLSAAFIADLQEDWEKYGTQILELMREKFPDLYFASIVKLAQIVRIEADVLPTVMENATQLGPLADSGETSSFNYLVGERRTVAGRLRPCAFAVLRLMTISNLVGCRIVRSAGWSKRRPGDTLPFGRIRSSLDHAIWRTHAIKALFDDSVDIDRPVLSGAMTRMQQHVLDDRVRHACRGLRLSDSRHPP